MLCCFGAEALIRPTRHLAARLFAVRLIAVRLMAVRLMAALLLALLLATAGRADAERRRDGEPHRTHGTTGAAAITKLAVPVDRSAFVAFGPKSSARAVVYLHGICGDPLAFSSWVSAATRHATVLSLVGELECDDKPGRTKWGYDFGRTNQRVTRALAAASAARRARGEAPLDDREVALIGYSQGARRAEWLAGAFPRRYRRVAIIGIAVEPSPARLGGAKAVLLMAGELDARKHILAGRDALQKAGKRVRYLELPNARHGEYGPKARSVMGEGLAWLFDAQDTGRATVRPAR